MYPDQTPKSKAEGDPDFINWIALPYTRKVVGRLRTEFDTDYLNLLEIFPALTHTELLAKLTALKTKRTLILCLTQSL